MAETAPSKTMFGEGSKMTTRETIRMKVQELPELDTGVAISGSSRQQEVGGGFCLGVAAGVAIYIASN